MIHALYIAREDGDYDFACAFNSELENAGQFVADVKEWLEHNGEEVILMDFSCPRRLVNILEAHKLSPPRKPPSRSAGSISACRCSFCAPG